MNGFPLGHLIFNLYIPILSFGYLSPVDHFTLRIYKQIFSAMQQYNNRNFSRSVMSIWEESVIKWIWCILVNEVGWNKLYNTCTLVVTFLYI